MKDIKVLGIDLAKDVCQIHGTDASGNRVLTKRLSRGKLTEYMANTPACLVGIEACGGAHYWARVFESHGHTVKIMSPQFVKAYVKSNKNDARDAEAPFSNYFFFLKSESLTKILSNPTIDINFIMA